MRNRFNSWGKWLLPLIDVFYPPFRRFMPLQTYRYAACGGINTLLGLTVYYIVFKFVLQAQELDLGFYVFKSHVAALLISFCFSFLLGFFFMKYVVFTNSAMRGKIQLFRYLLIYLVNLVLNYFLLKLMVEYMHIYAVFAQVFTTALIVVFSYLAQRHFSFKPNEEV